MAGGKDDTTTDDERTVARRIRRQLMDRLDGKLMPSSDAPYPMRNGLPARDAALLVQSVVRMNTLLKQWVE